MLFLLSNLWAFLYFDLVHQQAMTRIISKTANDKLLNTAIVTMSSANGRILIDTFGSEKQYTDNSKLFQRSLNITYFTNERTTSVTVFYFYGLVGKNGAFVDPVDVLDPHFVGI